MNLAVRTHREQAGLVGKIILIWLVLAAVIAVGAIDTASIAFTKFRVSTLASNAASAAANAWRDTNNEQRACGAARQNLASEDGDAVVVRNGCVVNEQTGEVTVTVRKDATTIAAQRLSWTKKLAAPEATATSGPGVR